MSAADVISLLGGTGGGTAVVFCALFLTGQIFTKAAVDRQEQQEQERLAEKDQQIRDLSHALDLERQRSDAGVMAGQLVRDVMAGLRKEIDR